MIYRAEGGKGRTWDTGVCDNRRSGHEPRICLAAAATQMLANGEVGVSWGMPSLGQRKAETFDYAQGRLWAPPEILIPYPGHQPV